ncbi:MAG: hypothetical protein ACLQMH_18540 [Solirubrobacteraceae bacterium]
MADRRTRLAGIAPTASVEQAAAIVAALERFRRATSAPAPPAGHAEDEWLRAAMLEGVSRRPHGDTRDPWINT